MSNIPPNPNAHDLPLPNAPDDKKPSDDKSYPPTPRPFDITEPFQERGVWCFWLTAEPHIQEYISSLNCILGPKFNTTFFRRPGPRVMYSMNPRYDHEETWLWIHDLLQTETHTVELADVWEDAINDVIESSQDARRPDDSC